MGVEAGTLCDGRGPTLPIERWPIERVALAALIDLGLSVEQIAAYFAVGPAQVAALCARYGLITESKD